MQDFAAIDFKTANFERYSVCSVSLVIVREGEIVNSSYSLTQPEPDYYHWRCTQVHGLTCADTDGAPVFCGIWRQIEPMIEGLPLTAHNASFDKSYLKTSFYTYRMDYPDYEFLGTLKAARRHFPHLPDHQLHTVSSACDYKLTDHHHTLADAEARMWIAREILQGDR